MRLTCPNCDAQYEVPDEVMPTSGRDVQCSNCGQTWFQHHPDHAPAQDDDDVGLVHDAGPDPDEEVSPPPPPVPPKTAPVERRKLDPAVADILRQEAEAEFEARKRDAPAPLETQTDLGLEETEATHRDVPDDTERRMMEAKRRMARMRGEPDPVQVAAAAGPRRELLPDIEEINSTLRSDTGRTRKIPDVYGAETNNSSRKKKGGFGRGFMLVVLLVVVLALVYVFAPQIAKSVPQVDPYLSSYVSWVDEMRIWLDDQLKALLSWLDSMVSQATG